MPEHPLYHDGGFENVQNELQDKHMRYAADHFGFQLLNLDEFDSDENGAKGKKHKKSKKPKESKESKDSKESKESKESKDKEADVPEKIK